jgi:hypothetical protein
MSIKELQQQTTVNVQEKANLIWAIADNMRQGDTLGDDKFDGYKFDYIISNPPFGIEWKTSKHKVRAVWDEEKSAWWFSIVDIVEAITDSPNPRKYWSVLKTRLKKAGNELTTRCSQLKMTAADGKRYATDCFAQEDIIQLVRVIPSKKTEEFLNWFVYSDSTIDGQSKKKAYTLMESGLLESMRPGTVKCLQQIHAFLFGGLYDFAGKIRSKTIAKGNTIFCLAEHLHWEVLPHKRLMRKRKELCAKYGGEDIISLTTNGVIVRDLTAGGKMPTTFDGYQYVYPGNLLMCLFDIDVTPRCVGYVKNKGLTSPAYSRFEMSNSAYGPYYDYLLRYMDDEKCLLHLSLTAEDFGAIKTIMPPFDEQQAIASYLDSKCADIDRLIAVKQHKIEKLKDYKKSVIYEAVTGKTEIGE